MTTDALWTRFAAQEQTADDMIFVRKVYVDVTENLQAGMVLHDIVFWTLPGKDGKPKLRIEQDSHLWLVRTRTDWWDTHRLTERQFDHALSQLKRQKLVIVRLYKFKGVPTTHIRLNKAEFLRRWHEVTGADPDLVALLPQPGGGKMGLTQSVKPDLHKVSIPYTDRESYRDGPQDSSLGDSRSNGQGTGSDGLSPSDAEASSGDHAAVSPPLEFGEKPAPWDDPRKWTINQLLALSLTAEQAARIVQADRESGKPRATLEGKLAQKLADASRRDTARSLVPLLATITGLNLDDPGIGNKLWTTAWTLLAGKRPYSLGEVERFWQARNGRTCPLQYLQVDLSTWRRGQRNQSGATGEFEPVKMADLVEAYRQDAAAGRMG